MSFMQPEIWEACFYTVDTNIGTEIIPVSVCGLLPIGDGLPQGSRILAHFRDYIEGCEVHSVNFSSGWLYRLSAPGYLDCTEPGYAETEKEAIEAILELYGNDDSPEEWEESLRDQLNDISAKTPAVGQIWRTDEGAEYCIKDVFPESDNVRVARLINGSEFDMFIWKTTSLINSHMTLVTK